MRTNFEKSLKIAGELLSYCHKRGADDLHLDINLGAKSSVIEIKARQAELSEHDLSQLTKLLNAPRQREVEQDFWELMGESEDSCELTLIGMLIDEALVTFESGMLDITLFRHA